MRHARRDLDVRCARPSPGRAGKRTRSATAVCDGGARPHHAVARCWTIAPERSPWPTIIRSHRRRTAKPAATRGAGSLWGAHNVPLVDAADLGAAPPPVEPAGAPPPCCAGLAGARAGTRCGASHGRRRRSSRCTASIRASTPWASAKQCGWRCSSGSARRSSRNGCHHGSVSRLLVTPGPAGSIKLPHSSQINSAPRRMGDIVPHRPLRCAARRGSAHEPYQDGVDAGELRSFLPAGLTAARAGIWRSWRR